MKVWTNMCPHTRDIQKPIIEKPITPNPNIGNKCRQLHDVRNYMCVTFNLLLITSTCLLKKHYY